MKKNVFFFMVAFALWNMASAQKDSIMNDETIQVLSYELPSSSLSMEERAPKGRLKIVSDAKNMSVYIPCIQNQIEIPFGGDIKTMSIEGNMLTLEGQAKAFNRPFILIFRLTSKEKIRFEEFNKKCK